MSLSDIAPYSTIVIAVVGWLLLFGIFSRSAFFRGGVNLWFLVMGVGAVIAISGAVARIATDDKVVEDWGGWLSIAGLLIEVGPLLIGSAKGRRST